MRTALLVILAALLLAGTPGTVRAGTQIQANRITDISASIENTGGHGTGAAVKLLAYDDAGTVIGHVCREIYLPANDVTTVNYAWRAPAYATGVYWSSKITPGGSCLNHDGDDTDSDSDSDGDSDDSDHH